MPANQPPTPDDEPTGAPSVLHGNYRARNGKGSFERSLESVKRDARAAELRSQNWTLQEIADELGYTDKSNVRAAITRAHQDVAQGPAQQMLNLYTQRLEDIFQKTMEIAEEDHLVVSHGRIITDATGVPLRDHSATLAAFREARATLADVRKMLGLDQPTKVDARITEVTPQDAELQEILREAKAQADLEEQQLRNGSTEA